MNLGTTGGKIKLKVETVVNTIVRAGRNRHLLSFKYAGGTTPGSVRMVEAYSFRQKSQSFLFFAWDVEANGIRSYKLSLMSEVKETDTFFFPRFPVEL